ncbi:radical SAM family heme chaperone HemW [Tropicimonas sp. IMCC34043]|uniref:radical SAM family heme chaperone HemW n=1 Tax=Tropicimonas sp. IMCC34043 TaxID=2248760 RepID=UPI000E282E33|nr:radical SAM family heme chaperone HemW [Tropicimonas sp. IMCC34043]
MLSPSWLLAALPAADPPRADWVEAGFGLYLHWPFCQSKCPYCDFNSHVAASIDQPRWAAAFAAGIARVAARTEGRVLRSVYFGGGTPSLMAPETVAAVLDTVRAMWPVANDWEVTLEANPTSVEAGRFAGYREAGVNRLSLGVQALNDDDLRQLGRRHTAAEAVHAFEIARATFERVSFDLIYARQDQSLVRWQAELDRALALAIDHLSLYQLTIEPGTAFGARFAAGGLRGLPDEDLAADMYDATLERCATAGLDAYEVSNFARSGAESQHNMLYWNGGDYAGIGPGAHGRLTLAGTRHATVSPSAPEIWLQATEADAPAAMVWEPLSGQERAEEYLMMGLRVRQGISLARAQAMGVDPGLSQRIFDASQDGLLEIDGDRVRATARGRLLLNALLRNLLVGESCG